MAELHYIDQDLEDVEVDWDLFERWRAVWYAHWLASPRTLQDERAGAHATQTLVTVAPRGDA